MKSFYWTVGPIYLGPPGASTERLDWVVDFWGADSVIKLEQGVPVYYLSGNARWDVFLDPIDRRARDRPLWVRRRVRRTSSSLCMCIFSLLTDVLVAAPPGVSPCMGVLTQHEDGQDTRQQVLVLPQGVFYAEDTFAGAERLMERGRRATELQCIYPGLRVDDELMNKWPFRPLSEAKPALFGSPMHPPTGQTSASTLDMVTYLVHPDMLEMAGVPIKEGYATWLRWLAARCCPDAVVAAGEGQKWLFLRSRQKEGHSFSAWVADSVLSLAFVQDALDLPEECYSQLRRDRQPSRHTLHEVLLRGRNVLVGKGHFHILADTWREVLQVMGPGEVDFSVELVEDPLRVRAQAGCFTGEELEATLLAVLQFDWSSLPLARGVRVAADGSTSPLTDEEDRYVRAQFYGAKEDGAKGEDRYFLGADGHEMGDLHAPNATGLMGLEFWDELVRSTQQHLTDLLASETSLILAETNGGVVLLQMPTDATEEYQTATARWFAQRLSLLRTRVAWQKTVADVGDEDE